MRNLQPKPETVRTKINGSPKKGFYRFRQEMIKNFKMKYTKNLSVFKVFTVFLLLKLRKIQLL